MKKKNQEFIINDSDKNLGAAAAETKDVIKESTRQLYDINNTWKKNVAKKKLFSC